MQNEIITDSWSEKVARLMELVARKTEAIRIHQQQPKPDLLAIEQYGQKRAEYLNELSSLMQTYGIRVQFELPPLQAA
jgi:ATP-dependent exoDNAse (exonuclease V) alpha subunit